jgi:hypothetical protein
MNRWLIKIFHIYFPMPQMVFFHIANVYFDVFFSVDGKKGFL